MKLAFLVFNEFLVPQVMEFLSVSMQPLYGRTTGFTFSKYRSR